MGHEDNITNHTLEHMAKDEGRSFDALRKELLQMLQKGNVDSKYNGMFEKAAKAWGQSVEEAKQETQKLLTQELKRK
jgi:hypothetical protein